MDYTNHMPNRCELEDWKWIRQAVFDRDGHECQLCGNTNNLNAHHMTYKHERTSDQAEIDDCVTLCKNCHERMHTLIEAEVQKSFEKYFPNRMQSLKLQFNSVPIRDILLTLRYLDVLNAQKAIRNFGQVTTGRRHIIVKYATNCVNEAYTSKDHRKISTITGLRSTYRKLVDEASGEVLYQLAARKEKPKRPDTIIKWW